jgi:PAS domain S-box-containing protein
MFHSSPDVMILSTVADGRLVEVNDTFLKLRQLKREDVIGRTGAELGLWHDGAERERVIEAVRIDGMARNIPSAHQSLDPEKGLRHYAASAELVRLGEDELLLWVARDITDLRRTEEELRRSKRGAEEASRAKSEFLAHMSHELRTPLNAILGFSEVIRDRVYGPDASSKYTEYAECIYSAGEHLLQIINDVLALSKVEHGKLTLQESDFSAEELINDCLRMVRQAAKKAGLQLNASPVDPKLVIRADERLMRQVLLNLLSNAIKFTPPQGRVSLSIEVLRPTNGARIIVSDTGIGMSEADIAIALTPFGQIEGGLTRRHEGTGLGLPLTRSLVELHGGELKVRSEPNVGTTVAITLPTERTVSSSSIDKPTEMPVR